MASEQAQSVVTRFPPSPTGFLHIGRVRTALYNYLFAKQNGGKMVFRIEDTDKERSKKEFEENIIDSLKWLNIAYDEGPFRQSERSDVYKKYLNTLISEGKAYVSKEIPKEPGDRTEVIRFKNPNKKISFTDLIRGPIEFDTTELGDFVIARSLEEPVYHLAVVIDDHEMGITHIIRGDDGISNTPRQILIQEAIGANKPIYAHLPLILAPDRSKLSGRHGAVSVTEYREKGYLPEALINYLALLGWNPGDDREILSMDDLIKEFRIEKVQKGGAIFNEEKLKWVNREYIKKISNARFLEILTEKLPDISEDVLTRSIPMICDRIYTLNDITDLKNQGEFDYLSKAPDYDTEKLLWKGTATPEVTAKHLIAVHEILSALPEVPSSDETKTALWQYATDNGRGEVLWPLRYALSGKEKSPDPFILISILGTVEARARIDKALTKLKSIA